MRLIVLIALVIAYFYSQSAVGADGALDIPAASPQQPPLRHGTLLLCSITVLDRPASSLPQQSLTDGLEGSDHAPQRCCLTVKAYITSLHHSSSSSTAQPTALQVHAAPPSATFSLCSNSTTPSAGCQAALVAGSSSSSPAAYKLALLLPAQQLGQLPSPAVPVATHSTTGRPQPVTPSSTHSSSNTTTPETPSSDIPHASTAAEQDGRPAGGAQHLMKPAGLQDMLVTVHVEQEVSGQVYLAIMTQVVRTGAGVAKVAINMAHYSHTWTKPLPRQNPPQLNHSSASTTTAAAVAAVDNANTSTAASSAPAEEETSASGTLHTLGPVAITAGTAAVQQHHCSNPNNAGRLQQSADWPAGLSTAAGPALDAAAPGLSELLPPGLAADPAAMAVYLHAVLGHDMPDPGHTRQQQTACSSSNSNGGTPLHCSCPAFASGTASIDAARAWAAELHLASTSCPHDASLSGHLQAAAAAAALAAAEADAHAGSLGAHQQTQQQRPLWVQQLLAASSTPGLLGLVLTPLARAVELVIALPIVSAVTPEQRALGIAAAATFLLLIIFVTTCRSGSWPRRSLVQLVASVKKPSAQRPRVDRAPGIPAAQDACPAQQQDQNGDIEDMLQVVDADIFGYGTAAPPALPAAAAAATTATAAARPGSVSLLAAAKAVRRASVMAAGEAASALKDAFLRRTLSPHGAATAGQGYSGAADLTAADPGAQAAAGEDWLTEEDEDKVNQLPDSVQRRLQAGGRWARDAEGRLVRSSFRAVRNSLAAAAQAVMTAVGAGNEAPGAAGTAAAAGGAAAGLLGMGAAADEDGDATALQQLLSNAPGDVVMFAAN